MILTLKAWPFWGLSWILSEVCQLWLGWNSSCLSAVSSSISSQSSNRRPLSPMKSGPGRVQISPGQELIVNAHSENAHTLPPPNEKLPVLSYTNCSYLISLELWSLPPQISENHCFTWASTNCSLERSAIRKETGMTLGDHETHLLYCLLLKNHSHTLLAF